MGTLKGAALLHLRRELEIEARRFRLVDRGGSSPHRWPGVPYLARYANDLIADNARLGVFWAELIYDTPLGTLQELAGAALINVQNGGGTNGLSNK